MRALRPEALAEPDELPALAGGPEEPLAQRRFFEGFERSLRELAADAL